MTVHMRLTRSAMQKLPLQPDDVLTAFADNSSMQAKFGHKPATSIETCDRKLVRWRGSY
jgi:hypothetical protein